MNTGSQTHRGLGGYRSTPALQAGGHDGLLQGVGSRGGMVNRTDIIIIWHTHLNRSSLDSRAPRRTDATSTKVALWSWQAHGRARTRDISRERFKGPEHVTAPLTTTNEMYTDRCNVCVIVGHGVTVNCNLWASNGTLAVVTSSHLHGRPVVRRSPRVVIRRDVTISPEHRTRYQQHKIIL